MGRIITIICIVFLIIGCFWWWRNYHPSTPYDGALRREAAMENGMTTMENGRNLGEAHPTPSRSDAPGTINGDPYNPSPDDSATQTRPTQNDPYPANGPYSQKPGVGRDRRDDQHSPEYSQPARDGRRPEGAAYVQPAGDSQPPDNPEGVRFAGSGPYQWYRQGDLTYRIDTRTGQSCIIYATMEEWRMPFVYRHGCRAH